MSLNNIGTGYCIDINTVNNTGVDVNYKQSKTTLHM